VVILLNFAFTCEEEEDIEFTCTGLKFPNNGRGVLIKYIKTTSERALQIGSWILIAVGAFLILYFAAGVFRAMLLCRAMMPLFPLAYKS
jgi:hypothetical protein